MELNAHNRMPWEGNKRKSLPRRELRANKNSTHLEQLLSLVLGTLDPRAADAATFVNDSPGKPPVNHLRELEIRSALRQKIGRGEATQTECDALIAQVESALFTGVHEPVTGS